MAGRSSDECLASVVIERSPMTNCIDDAGGWRGSVGRSNPPVWGGPPVYATGGRFPARNGGAAPAAGAFLLAQAPSAARRRNLGEDTAAPRVRRTSSDAGGGQAPARTGPDRFPCRRQEAGQYGGYAARWVHLKRWFLQSTRLRGGSRSPRHRFAGGAGVESTACVRAPASAQHRHAHQAATDDLLVCPSRSLSLGKRETLPGASFLEFLTYA